MKYLRALALGMLGLALFAAAGCTTTGPGGPSPIDQINTALRESMPKTCALIQTGHDAFLIFVEGGKISADAIAREKAAYDGIQVFCEDPASVTVANAPLLVARAYVTITVALDNARKQE